MGANGHVRETVQMFNQLNDCNNLYFFDIILIINIILFYFLKFII